MPCADPNSLSMPNGEILRWGNRMSDAEFPEPDPVAEEPSELFTVENYSVTDAVRDRQSAGLNSRKSKPLEGLIADRSGRRLWANECDFLIAAVFAMTVVILLPDFDPLLKGLSFYLFFLLYYQITEYFGATPAKWWFGLCVRTINGGRASFSQIAIRTLFRVVEVNPIFLGLFPAALAVLCTRRHIRLGDWFAGTVVVRIEDVTLT